MQTIRTVGFATLILGLMAVNAQAADYSKNANRMTNRTTSNANIDRAVDEALRNCQRISQSCAQQTRDAYGVLVFPSVVKADLIVGGEGGKGALVENGRIVGYYNLGAASAGLQAGIDKSSQVYVFRTREALAKLKQSPEWKVGANAGVTLVTADANAQGINGDILAYVFDAKGLNAGIALNVFDVWKSGEKRPA